MQTVTRKQVTQLKTRIKYILHDYSRSYHYLAPLTLFLIVVLVSYSSKPNFIMDSYAFTALLMYFVSAWLCISLFAAEPEIQKQLTILHMGNVKTYYVTKVLSTGVISLALACFAVIFPLVSGMFHEPVTWKIVLFVLLNHLLFGLLGISLAAFFTKEFIKSPINGFGGLLLILIASVPFESLYTLLPSPVNQLLWVLPPVSHTISALDAWDRQSIGINLLLPFLAAAAYVAAMQIIFLTLVKKRR